jgi:TetR/AcrR family transcriptional regulator
MMRERDNRMSENQSGKEKILKSALIEFAEYGFEGARVDRIASEAGVNKALIYYHFNSKKELFIATLAHLFEIATPKPMEMSADLTVRQKILLLMRQFVLFLHHNPLFIKMMDQAVYMDREIFEKLYEQNVFFEMGIALYEEGIAKNEIRRVDEPVDYLTSLMGACYFFYSHRNAINKFYRDSLAESDILHIRLATMEDILDRVLFTI